jgi:hypothetical protein
METRNAMKHHWDIEAFIEHCTLPPQVLAAKVAGQNRLEITRRYHLPSAKGREEAQEGLLMGNFLPGSPLLSLP